MSWTGPFSLDVLVFLDCWLMLSILNLILSSILVFSNYSLLILSIFTHYLFCVSSYLSPLLLQQVFHFDWEFYPSEITNFQYFMIGVYKEAEIAVKEMLHPTRVKIGTIRVKFTYKITLMWQPWPMTHLTLITLLIVSTDL